MNDHRPVDHDRYRDRRAPSDRVLAVGGGPTAPCCCQDHYLIQKMCPVQPGSGLPERVVHAKGGGAYGVFEATEDVSQYTKADMFPQGNPADRHARIALLHRGGQSSASSRHGARPARPSRSSSTPSRGTTIWSATTRRSSSSARPAEVLRLHPLAEAARGHPTCTTTTMQVGFPGRCPRSRPTRSRS